MELRALLFAQQDHAGADTERAVLGCSSSGRWRGSTMVVWVPVVRKFCKQSQLHLPASLRLWTACQT